MTLSVQKLPLRGRLRAAAAALRGDPPIPIGRRTLAARREAETFKFDFWGHVWYATVGRFNDGGLAELFLSTAKPGDSLRAMSNDMAIVASLALQYGCPMETLRDALTRDGGGEPATPLSAALDQAEAGAA